MPIVAKRSPTSAAAAMLSIFAKCCTFTQTCFDTDFKTRFSSNNRRNSKLSLGMGQFTHTHPRDTLSPHRTFTGASHSTHASSPQSMSAVDANVFIMAALWNRAKKGTGKGFPYSIGLPSVDPELIPVYRQSARTNTGRKKSPSRHHRTTLSGYIFETKGTYRQSEKPIKQQYLLHMS